MKRFILTNLLLLSSASLFTACSSKDAQPKTNAELLQLQEEQRSALPIVTSHPDNRVQIEQRRPRTEAELFQLQQERIAQLPLATTYPLYRRSAVRQTYYDISPPTEMETIEVVDRPRIQRRYSNYHRERYFQPQSQPLQYRNYRNNLYNITRLIENNSKKLLGKKYVWGATGPYNYDCSGFTQKVYRDAGITIPRVSRDQARVGKYVSYQDLQKGDMVFFDTHKKRTGRVSHVGIYLGNGNFIHASSGAKKVVIFNFNEKTFYKKRFLWGRRVIQDNHYMASL